MYEIPEFPQLASVGEPLVNLILEMRKLRLQRGSATWGHPTSTHTVTGSLRLSIALEAQTWTPEPGDTEENPDGAAYQLGDLPRGLPHSSTWPGSSVGVISQEAPCSP